MACISKKELLKPLSLKTEKFELPEFGDGKYVNIRALSSRQLLELQKEVGTEVDSSHSFEFAVKLLMYCLANDEGERLFSSEDEVRGMLDHSHKLIERLGQAAIEISGLSPEKKS